MVPSKCKELVSDNFPLTLLRKSELLGVSRKCVYRREKMEIIDETLLNAIDAIYTESPYFGQRRIRIVLLRDYRIYAGRRLVRRAMKILCIEAMGPKKNTSLPNPQHKKYPYLLKGLKIERVNQVWGCDITYIRLEHGWVYLVAIIDWFSRKALSWKLSVSMETTFCIDCLNDAVERFGIPDIFNNDQ